MSFESILFEKAADRPLESTKQPAFFSDLNLDQITESLLIDRQQYNLKEVFWSHLATVEAIEYRHEVMKDLDNPRLAKAVESFADRMRTVRDYLTRADRIYYDLQKQRWHADAAEVYCDAIDALLSDLSRIALKSRGFGLFLEYLKGYFTSPAFIMLRDEMKTLKADVSGVNYCVQLRGKRIVVRRCEDEVDYSAEVSKAFERFGQGTTRDYRAKFPETSEMNPIEAEILEGVAQLYPEVFEAMGRFSREHPQFVDEKISTFDREVQFYIGYAAYIAPMIAAGLKFCYPKISATDKSVIGRDCFDLALAKKLASEGKAVVPNDFSTKDRERILVVTGPNQGGKTTFARMFGQAHYLAALGLPVAGTESHLFLFDQMFTHFERGENVEDLRSKLEDDLTRIRNILEHATSRSMIIANEILTSTTLNDAVFLGQKVMEAVSRLELLCVWVTFVEELASYNEKTVSFAGVLDDTNPANRTYKIVRRGSHGVFYASAMASKYRLTYEALKERVLP